MTTFIGGYVDDVRTCLTASALAAQHAVVLGAPGWGKTAIARALAQRMAPDAWTFVRLDPSTPPDVVRGAYNPAALLEGRLERVVDGTPYDPRVRVVILDEVFRASDVVYDALLDVLDRLDADPDAAAVAWATANFVAQGERVEALLDRIALWLWLQPDTLDAGAIVQAHLNGLQGLDVPGDVPDWKTIEEVRAARPGPKATKAVADLLSTLAQEAAAQGRRPHPRRLAQWTRLVYRAAVYHTGEADFAAVPDEAARVLRWAWPAPTAEEAATWSQIAAAIVDAVGAAIEAAMAQALQKFREVASLADPAQRTGRVAELGQILAQTQESLRQIGGDDPRVDEAIETLTRWFAAAVRGEVPNGN